MSTLVHALLALAALGSAALLVRAGGRACVLAALGLITIGAAGLLGVLVDVGVSQLTAAHQGLQVVGDLVGWPLVAVGHLDAIWGRRDVPVVLIAVVGLAGGAALLGSLPAYQIGIGVVGMFGVVVAARAHHQRRHQATAVRLATAGAVLVVVALALGREGLIGELERASVNHALQALGAVLLALSLIVLSPPVGRRNARKRA